jgi:hypothetical protein
MGVYPAIAQQTPAAQHQEPLYHVEAQSLGNALRQFAAQAKVQMLFTEADVAGKNSPGLQGSYAPEEAIRRLLAGSGLMFESSTPGTFLIQLPEKRSGATELPAPAPTTVRPRQHSGDIPASTSPMATAQTETDSTRFRTY